MPLGEKGPKRDILRIIQTSPGTNKGLLRCGHITYSNGVYWARCWICKKQREEKGQCLESTP